MDEAGHELDVQLERVMRASVARLGYEWRRTKKREKQLAGTLLHLRTWPDSCFFCDCFCGLSGGFLGALSVEFHEDAILELERQGSVVDSLVAKVEEMDQLLAQLEQL